MSDDTGDRREHPVLTGLIALVAVAAAVGLLLGLGTLVLSRALGVSGGGGKTGAGEGQTMVIPTPSDTATGDKPTKRPKPGGQQSSSAAATGITLQTGQTSVGSMSSIELSGTYAADGAILQVQRFEGGAWVDFPVSTSVSGNSFSTTVQTGHVGVNRFRMIDTSAGATSNEVKVTVG